MKPDNDVGAVAEFIPFLDSRIKKIIVDDEDVDESQSREEDSDKDRS